MTDDNRKCDACGAPFEIRDGTRLATCDRTCPSICEGIAVRIRLGAEPEFVIGTISPRTGPPSRAGLADYRADLSRLLRAAADQFAQPGHQP